MDPLADFLFGMSYCGPPPVPDDLWSRWNLDPVLITVLAAGAILGLFLLRDAAPWRKASLLSAIGLMAVLFVSPFCALTVALFSARVGHHMALTLIVAPLLATVLPCGWGEKVPLISALAASTIVLWLWHLPEAYASTFAHPALYWAMQASLLVTATILWAGLLRGRDTAGVVLAALGNAIQMGMLGALLVFASGALYAPHLATSVSFGLSAIEDQQLGGLIMWVPAALPLLAVIVWRVVLALGPNAPSEAR